MRAHATIGRLDLRRSFAASSRSSNAASGVAHPKLACFDELDDVLRLLVAAGTGLLIGIDRDMNDKPMGMRTLALGPRLRVKGLLALAEKYERRPSEQSRKAQN
ncbi:MULTISPECIES: MgtC/SapB family protein [unclassified Bradyrhizobium]|uniref:MgtC/SapB family protein n=1 Tax=unclassified Bradyrhizobium TaxID=2631580 RepID=UPI001FF8E730|nr:MULTISPECIES: MgtC/SapB family protein [unclassified Bradyrhizobium]